MPRLGLAIVDEQHRFGVAQRLALRQKGIGVSEDMDGPLRPGSVVFVETGDGITHRDYVNRAWTQYPLKDVLVKMSATPSLALTRVASTNSSASSR